jgi:hypothetical protein
MIGLEEIHRSPTTRHANRWCMRTDTACRVSTRDYQLHYLAVVVDRFDNVDFVNVVRDKDGNFVVVRYVIVTLIE